MDVVGILILCLTLLLLQIVAVRALRAPTSAAHPMTPLLVPDDDPDEQGRS